MTEITASLDRAFGRIADFEAVQKGRSFEELCIAVELLQESVGIDAETRCLIRERLDELRGSKRAPGHVLLGIIAGLMAAELQAEREAGET